MSLALWLFNLIRTEMICPLEVKVTDRHRGSVAREKVNAQSSFGSIVLLGKPTCTFDMGHETRKDQSGWHN